ncbi:ribosomal maturation YjgA family protein [Streptomyces sp. NPDC002740]
MTFVARFFETRDCSADHVRTRLTAAGAAVVTVGAGSGLRTVAAGNLAKYGGDALYTLLLFTLFVLVAPRVRPPTAAGVALAVSWAVEFLQLSPVPTELSRHSTLAHLVLGSTFNAPDLFWYAVGAGVGWLVHTALGSFSSHRRRSRPACPQEAT